MYGRLICVFNAFMPSGLAVDRQWPCTFSALECHRFLGVLSEVRQRIKVKKSSDNLVLLFSYP